MVIELKETTAQDGYWSIRHPPRFQIQRSLRGGSFGEVFLGTDSKGGEENQQVVIKRLGLNNVQLRKRYAKYMLREMAILRFALHPQIVDLKTIYMDLDENNNPKWFYIVMEYCGENLTKYVDRFNDGISLKEAADITYNIARGLKFLQELEIYHRDLKPANICIVKTNRNFKAKIIDLGLARKKPASSREITRKISTICYRAPENLLGLKYDRKQDIWSLGCILAFMLLNEHIFILHDKYSTLDDTKKTLKKMVEILGKPPVREFISDVEKSLSPYDDTEGSHWQWFKKELEDDKVPSEGKGFDFYQDRSAELDQATSLLKSMLDWRIDGRITISEIIEHPFVQDCRRESQERLPARELVDKVKGFLEEVEEEIKKYENRNDYDGLLNECIKSYVAGHYGYDKDVQDHYSYSTRGEGPITESTASDRI